MLCYLSKSLARMFTRIGCGTRFKPKSNLASLTAKNQLPMNKNVRFQNLSSSHSPLNHSRSCQPCTFTSVICSKPKLTNPKWFWVGIVILPSQLWSVGGVLCIDRKYHTGVTNDEIPVKNTSRLQKTNKEKATKLFQHMVSANKVSKRDYIVVDILEVLFNIGFDQSDVEFALKRNTYLFRNYSTAQWAASTKQMQNIGFRNDDIMYMLTKNRTIFDLSDAELLRITYALRQVFQTDVRMRMLCTKLPILLTMSFDEVEKQFAQLCDLFTKKDLYELIDRTPAMFLNDITDITTKLEYVMNTLRVPEKHVSKTYLFKHSLEHLIARSEMLLKSGLYVRPNKHGHSPVKNATLREIIDTSDENFCKVVAGCTMAEYKAYWDMFELYDTRSETVIEQEELLREKEERAENEEYDDDEDDEDGDDEDDDDDDEYEKQEEADRIASNLIEK